MPKFRKKPVVIEAHQYDGSDESGTAIFKWAEHCEPRGKIVPYRGRLVVYTLEGDMAAAPGDYIIRGVHGEFYPCKEQIFNATYEPVD